MGSSLQDELRRGDLGAMAGYVKHCPSNLTTACCEILNGPESWWCMDLQTLDQMHYVITLPSEDVSAQVTREAFWREGSLLWMSLLAAWRTLLERWQVHRPQALLSLVVYGVGF